MSEFPGSENLEEFSFFPNDTALVENRVVDSRHSESSELLEGIEVDRNILFRFEGGKSTKFRDTTKEWSLSSFEGRISLASGT